jgi:nitroreductase
MTLITDIHDRSAVTDAPLMPILAERWSPRGFDRSAVIDETTLTTVLEAARWSPSGNNSQPSRYIVARRGSASFAKIHDAMVGFNKAWADSASVLIVNIAVMPLPGDGENPWARYDLGQAVAHLSIQAQHEGLHSHQMSGFNAEQVATAFDLPANYSVVSVIALGVLGDIESLPAALLQRESAPRTRKPLSELLLVND